VAEHSGPIGEPTLSERLRTLGARFKKLGGAVLGGATGVGVAALLDALGWPVSEPLAGAIAMVLAAVGTGIAPANTPKE
jgi:hypothetical protein